MKIIINILISVSVLFIFSCKNEPTNTPEYNLTRGGTRSWKLQDIRTGENQQEQLFRDCNKDDSFDFLHNGKWYFQPGNVKCNEAEGLVQGNWGFNETKNQIVITSESIWEGNYTIMELSTDKLILDSKGRRYTFTCGCKSK